MGPRKAGFIVPIVELILDACHKFISECPYIVGVSAQHNDIYWPYFWCMGCIGVCHKLIIHPYFVHIRQMTLQNGG